MCGIIFNRHKWEELGNRRICHKCGERQVHIGGYESSWWEKATPVNLGQADDCYRCRGKGLIFDNDFTRKQCPDCGGHGLIYK